MIGPKLVRRVRVRRRAELGVAQAVALAGAARVVPALEATLGFQVVMRDLHAAAEEHALGQLARGHVGIAVGLVRAVAAGRQLEPERLVSGAIALGCRKCASRLLVLGVARAARAFRLRSCSRPLVASDALNVGGW